MKFLVECTCVFENSHINTGIQRVVRNIVKNLDVAGDIVTAVPVILRQNKVYEVKQLFPDQQVERLVSRIRSKVSSIRRVYWWYHSRTAKSRLFQPFPGSKNLLLAAYKMFGLLIDIPLFVISKLSSFIDSKRRIAELQVNPGDVLILLDIPWQDEFYQFVDQLKSQGVFVVSVVYDLIPLSHPHLCMKRLNWFFKNWIKWISQTADGFIAISETSRDQIKNYICLNFPETAKNKKWFDFFYLGTELDLANKKEGFVREKVKKPFENGFRVYLMVSAIEWRKNHKYLLDAFEILWRDGLSVSLVLAGAIGWKCEKLVKKINEHIEYNRRLFLFTDLNDTEIEYCYRNSRCLLFPSYIEGFGLPLVEAMQRGLPAMGSDITVFREVGGEFISYFDPDKPETLAALVQNFERSGKFPANKKLDDWSWLGWEDSTRQFLSKILSRIKAQENVGIQ